MGLLKKKKKSDLQQLQSIHEKSKLTLTVLSANLIVGDIPLENILQYYKEITRDNVILLTMRCKILYDARVQVKKIILLLL